MKGYFATLFLPPSVLTLLADAQPVFTNWEKLGIIGIMAIGIGWLARRDFVRDRDERKRVTDLETERLNVQKELLQAHKDNAANMQAMMLSQFQATHATAESQAAVAEALENLTEKVDSVPCHKRQ
jgi:hypothetical protein